MALSCLIKSSYTIIISNKFDINIGNNKNDSKINDKIANLSNNIKVKNSFIIGFLIFETSLVFI